MKPVIKHIIGWFLLAVFFMNGVAVAMPAIVKLMGKMEMSQVMESSETESSGEKEERFNEREVVRDHHHELDIEFVHIYTSKAINNDLHKSNNWPVVYLPVFTPPPECIA